MKIDGKVLEYKSPTKVNQVLSEFRDHAVSDTMPVLQYLEPNVELKAGHLYHLIPLSTQSPKLGKKKVRFSEPEVAEGRESKSSSIRIKLVISKQELKEIVENGVISTDGIVPEPHEEKLGMEELDEHRHGSKAWEPALRSIPEVD